MVGLDYQTRTLPQSLIISGYGPHITVINHDAADSSTQKGSAGGVGQIAGGRETGSTGAFLGPPGRVGMITGAPSPHQVLSTTSKFYAQLLCMQIQKAKNDSQVISSF